MSEDIPPYIVQPSPSLTLKLDITEEQTTELAQFIKRLTWTDIRNHAKNDEDAYTMQGGINALQKSLDAAGYSPR